MAFHKLGPHGNIQNNCGTDTGMKLDSSGNILDRFGTRTGRSVDSRGNILDGKNGLGLMTGLRFDSLGGVVDGGLPSTVDGRSPFTGTQLGRSGGLEPAPFPMPFPPGRPTFTSSSTIPIRRSQYQYCAAKDDCDCGLPKVCTKTNCDCSRPKACTGSNACDCGARLKVCTDPDCDCGRPKVHP